MKHLVYNEPQEEWLRILTKGLVTIPKRWRDEFGVKKGDIVKAKKIKGQIIIEPRGGTVPFRVYSKRQLRQFLKDDEIV